MNNIEHKQDKVDSTKVKEYAEYLIKTHKGNPTPLKNIPFKKSFISLVLDEQAIHSSIITAKELATVTAKKFYYEVIQYLEKK